MLHTFVPKITCLSPGTNNEQRAYSHPMVRMTCKVDLTEEDTSCLDFCQNLQCKKIICDGNCLASSHSPVPHFDGLSRGREDGYVIGAEGQRSDICTMTTQCEPRGFIASRSLLGGLQRISLHCVILKKKSKLHLSIWSHKAVH